MVDADWGNDVRVGDAHRVRGALVHGLGVGNICHADHGRDVRMKRGAVSVNDVTDVVVC